MTFLEHLIAEWYAYRKYFVRTNIQYSKRSRGGYEGEMDVVAYDPIDKILIHVETSMDANSWEQRKQRFRKKFATAEKHYKSVFGFDFKKVKKICVVGFAKPQSAVDLGDDIQLIVIPELMRQITETIKEKHPLKEAVPEGYPLLRTIQFTMNWGIHSKGMK